MSSRQIRKLYGDNSIPVIEGDSDEDYEPLYVKGSSSKNRYKGLVPSSHSETEHESDVDPLVYENENQDKTSKKKKKKKKKHQQKKKTKYQQPGPVAENDEDLDEVERSVKEVNALLGTPPPVPSGSGEQKPARDTLAEIMLINYKHVNVANELERLFGPEEPSRKKRGRQPNRNKLLRRAIIVPPNEPPNYPRSGLSMSLIRRENGFTYFAFDHSREYQKIHRNFLQQSNFSDLDLPDAIENAQKKMHVEGLLQGADAMFRFESYSNANTIIEQAIAYMQYVAHPGFNLTNRNVRLEYIYIENRAFHVAVLKYLHMLTNRACHRTALELAKLLMNLDPSDPLAVVFIIDTLALRAREHQWLIDFVEYWDKERYVGLLFNIQYSCAMAHFHVASKNKEDLSKADEQLKSALLRFPYVYLKIMNHASFSIPAQINECALFATAHEKCSKSLIELMSLYAKFTCAKWREPPVFEWLTRNVNELVDSYKNDSSVQDLAKLYAGDRNILFKGLPDEVLRHMTVIRPMSNLLVDGAVPNVKRMRAADPVPPKGGKSRFGYYNRLERGSSPASQRVWTPGSPLFELVASLAPHYSPLPEHLFEHGIDPDEVFGGIDPDEVFGEIVPDEVFGPVENEPNLRLVVDSSTDSDEDLGPAQPPPEFANSPEEEADIRSRSLASSVGAITNTIRRFIDVYQASNIVTYDTEEDTDDEEEYLPRLAATNEATSESDEGEEYNFL